MSLIIKESDPRYDRLSEIFSNYSWLSCVIHEGRHVEYLIPHELVIKDYITSYVNVTPDKNKSRNWVSRFVLERVCNQCCLITSQEYFDLIELHINDTSDRPRCCYCGGYVPWSGRVVWGYNQSKPWKYVDHLYCSNSHAKKYQSTHPEEFPIVASEIKHWMSRGWDADSIIKAARSRYLSLGAPDDEVMLYLSELSDGRIKFGLTTDLVMRQKHEWINGNEIISIKCLFTGSRVECADLEALIKSRFNGREYLDPSELDEFNSIFSELAVRPIASYD